MSRGSSSVTDKTRLIISLLRDWKGLYVWLSGRVQSANIIQYNREQEVWRLVRCQNTGVVFIFLWRGVLQQWKVILAEITFSSVSPELTQHYSTSYKEFCLICQLAVWRLWTPLLRKAGQGLAPSVNSALFTLLTLGPTVSQTDLSLNST